VNFLRRFIAGLEPALQAKLYEFGVTTLEDAITELPDAALASRISRSN